MAELSSWTLPGAAPRYATAPTPGSPNAGARFAAVARSMGRPPMPWQLYTATVATERIPQSDCPGCAGFAFHHRCPYRYQVIVVTVPRQSGKTTLLFALGCERCISEDGHGWFYTAQTGKDARARWNDGVKLVQESPLGPVAKVRRAAGQERIVWPNGSELRCFAPTADSLHGYTPPTVCLDESFAHTEAQGDALMGAIGPSQITLPHRQLWIVSTMGTAESVFLQRWVDAGRAGVDGVALFDWGAADGVDVYDPEQLVSFHPALGLDANNGITVESILAEAERLPRSEFERAYGNRPSRTKANEIPPDDWRQLGAVQVPPSDPKAITLTYAVPPDGSSGTIAACWTDAGGRPQAKLVRWAPGHSWVADDVAQLVASWKPRRVAAPSNAATRQVTDELARRKVRDVRQLTSGEWAQSWANIVEGIRTRGFGHDGSPHLADAAANVASRPGETGAAVSWKLSAGDVGPFVAVMVGLWVQDAEPPTSSALDVRFG